VGVIAPLVAAVALAVTPAQFLQSRQAADGGFAEPGGQATPGLTAWAALGLATTGAPTGGALEYLRNHESGEDPGLMLLAEAALGRPSPGLADRARAQIGAAVNRTCWSVLGLRQAAERVPASAQRFLLARQTRAGGWSWSGSGAPDSNDTAAAVEALRALGIGGAPIRRGLAFLRSLQNRDGGFELSEGRGSDAQSTAWAIQAFVAAGQEPGRPAFAYLARLKRADGSYRYSARYAVTPVWVTAQVLPALARRSFPLR
jgi:energy-coupling factor transport system substrate-specific component